MASRDQLLAVHQERLERMREVMNLVGPGPVEGHYEDARRALEGLELTGHWVDLGTGAGFPGIVLAAMYPHLQVDLVDSRQKRCAFLDDVLARAQVDEGVRVLCRRTETLPSESYDGVTARAYAPPEQVLADALHLLRPGGRVILFLQGHADPPRVPELQVEEVRDYAIDGRARRAVVLKLG